MLLIAGFVEAVPTVIFFAEVQRRLPSNFGGRYFAIVMPLWDACIILGTAIAGVFVVTGLLTLGLTIFLVQAIPVVLLLRPLLLITSGTPRAGD